MVWLFLGQNGLLCLAQNPSDGQYRDPLPGTKLLTEPSDLASLMVDGIDRFLLQQIASNRAKLENTVVHASDLASRVQRLQWALGIEHTRSDGTHVHRLNRYQPGDIEWIHGLQTSAEVGEGKEWKAYWGAWDVFEDVRGYGLILIPEEVRFLMLLYPDAGQTPDALCGQGAFSDSTAIEWVEQGGVVLIPSVISRQREKRNGRAALTDQEFLYRSAFELGRHILGYQIQEGMSAVASLRRRFPDSPIFVSGWGEGGWLALHHAAIDDQVQGALVSGHFGPREQVWQEPIHRNVQGLLQDGTDALLATMVAHGKKNLMIDAIPGPEVSIPGEGGAPGEIHGPTEEQSKREFELAVRMLGSDQASIERLQWIPAAMAESDADGLIERKTQRPTRTRSKVMNLFLKENGIAWKNHAQAGSAEITGSHWRWDASRYPTGQQLRQATLQKWDRFQQRLLLQVHQEREEYWKGLNTSSLKDYEASIEPYREKFRREVIGWWDLPLAAPNPRSRKVYDHPKWDGYEVVLDVFENVIASGVLLIPKQLDPNRRHPCVVFQHGLEGRPRDVVEGNHEAYHDVAAKLAERGYIVFAPQNPYLFMDRFRTLQRKSNPLGRTLFSTIIPQHQQVATWLKSLPQVDGDRIGFYGLSYGGKSAMRIPALVPEYSLSICSADFNDWVWKNASTESPYSYVWTMEYEIFEFGLGPRFNYAEMARLICPRPFMVERGHFDGVAPDDRVAMEYAKVRHLYAAKLGIGSRTEIEWFVGPHTVHGIGSFQFLDKHLLLDKPLSSSAP